MITRRQFCSGLALASTAISVPTLTACGNAARRTSSQDSRTQSSTGSGKLVKVAWGPGASWGFVYAQEEDVFNRFGLNIDMTEGLNGAAMLTFLGKGAIQTATMAPSANVVANSIGLELMIVYAGASTTLMGLYARPGSGMTKDPSTWIGKRLAVTKNSEGDYGLRWSLRKAGIPWNKVNPRYLTPTAAVAAYQRGDIDGYYVWDIWGARMEKFGAHLVQKSVDVGFPSSSIWCMTKQYLQNNHDDAIRFVAALNTANQELAQDIQQGGHKAKTALQAVAKPNGITIGQARRLLTAQPPVGIESLLSSDSPLSFTNHTDGLASQVDQQATIAYDIGAIKKPITDPASVLAPVSLLKEAQQVSQRQTSGGSS